MSKKGSRVPKLNQAGVGSGGSAARTMKRARSVGDKRKAGAGGGNTVEAMFGAQGGGALLPSTANHMSGHHGAHPALLDGMYAPSPLMAAPLMGAPPYTMHANALLLPRPHDPSVHRMHGLAVGGDALAAATGGMPPGAYDYASLVPMDATSRPQMMGVMPGHAVSSSHTSVSQLTQQNIADFMKMQHQATVGARAAQLAPLQPSLPPTHLAHMPHPHAHALPQHMYGYAHSAPAAAPVAMSPMPLAQPPPAPGQSTMSHYGHQPHHQHHPPPHPAPAYRPVTNTSYQSSLEEERKRQKRALNRQSAQRCRKRKRAMLDDLKRTNKVFSAHAAILDSLNSMSIEFRVQTGAITFAQGTRHLGWEPSEVQQTNIYSYLEPSTRLRVDKVIRQLIDDWENTTNESGSSGQDPSSGSDSGGSSETTTTTFNESNGSGTTSKSGSTNGDSGDNSSDGSRSGEEGGLSGDAAARAGVGTAVGSGSGGGSAACSRPSTGTPPTSCSPSPPQQPTPPCKPSPMTDALAATQAVLPSDMHIAAAAGDVAKKPPPFKPVSSSKAGCSSQGNGAGGEEASKSSSAGSGTGTGVTSTTTTTTSLSKGRTISSSSLDPISEVQSDPSSTESSASALANRFTSREPGSSTNSNISQLLPFGHPASKEFTFQITKVDFVTRTHGCLRGEVNAVMTFEQSQGGGEHECLWSVRFYDIQPSHLRHRHKRRRQERGQVGSAGLHAPPSKPHSHSPPLVAAQKAGAAKQVHGSSVPAVTYSGSRGGLNLFMGSSSSGDNSPNTRESRSEDSGTPPPVGVHGEGEEDQGAAVTLD